MREELTTLADSSGQLPALSHSYLFKSKNCPSTLLDLIFLSFYMIQYHPCHPQNKKGVFSIRPAGADQYPLNRSACPLRHSGRLVFGGRGLQPIAEFQLTLAQGRASEVACVIQVCKMQSCCCCCFTRAKSSACTSPVPRLQATGRNTMYAASTSNS